MWNVGCIEEARPWAGAINISLSLVLMVMLYSGCVSVQLTVTGPRRPWGARGRVFCPLLISSGMVGFCKMKNGCVCLKIHMERERKHMLGSCVCGVLRKQPHKDTVTSSSLCLLGLIYEISPSVNELEMKEHKSAWYTVISGVQHEEGYFTALRL